MQSKHTLTPYKKVYKYLVKTIPSAITTASSWIHVTDKKEEKKPNKGVLHPQMYEQQLPMHIILLDMVTNMFLYKYRGCCNYKFQGLCKK